MTDNRVFSSLHGWLEVDRLQSAISRLRNPSIIYIPSGTWQGGVTVGQHNLTIIGAGEDSVIVGEEQPAISILSPNIRIINLAVRTENENSAITYSEGDAPQGILKKVTVLESGKHGVFRDNGYSSAINSIMDCDFRNIDEHAIFAEHGSGPQNLISGNTGENIEGDFIKWGVDSSVLLNNRCEDSPVNLTSDSTANLVEKDSETELNDDGEQNVII